MKRLALILTIALGLPLAPLGADAQQTGKASRIGFLTASFRLGESSEPFAQGMRDLGYTDYKDFVLEGRTAAGDPQFLSRLARELVDLKVDVIVADSTQAALAAKEATGIIPIVAVAGDPVGSKLVARLARPGGNVTGLSVVASELSGKRLQLLKDTLPGVSRVAVLWSADLTADAVGLREMQVAARSLGVRLLPLGAKRPSENDDALRAALREKAQGVIIFGGDPLAESGIVRVVARHRLPAMYDRREYVDAGGFMAFGVSWAAMLHRAATYVDKILKGARPADLPVEQPTKFELVVNLKTGKALGLTVPQHILIRADEVIW